MNQHEQYQKLRDDLELIRDKADKRIHIIPKSIYQQIQELTARAEEKLDFYRDLPNDSPRYFGPTILMHASSSLTRAALRLSSTYRPELFQPVEVASPET